MPVITSIKQQKDRQRINVYLDGKFGFGIDLTSFIKLNLRVEQELSEKEVETIIKKAEFQKIWEKLLHFAMLRPRSKKEISDWLIRKKVTQILHAKLFDRLKHLDLVDDAKFAAWWIEQRTQFKLKSKKEIGYELKGKGIGKETIESAVEDLPDERVLAKKLLAQKAWKWQKLEGQTARQKMSQYLARKGFAWEAIKSAVDEKVKKM